MNHTIAAWLCITLAALAGGAPPPAVPSPGPVKLRTPGPEPTPDQIAAYTAAADYSTGLSGRAVLIQVGGRTVFERYDNGWTAERPHPLASGTKSFTGVAAMMAVQDGLLSLGELASDTLTEWKSDPQKSKITIRHLLTLSSGLDPADDLLGGRGGSRLLGPGRGGKNEPQARKPEDEPADLFAESLGVSMTGTPGGQFKYGPSHFYAFGELLERKLAAAKDGPRTVLDYYQTRIFDPLGLRFRVGKDKSGHPKLPGGAVLTAREWATFGLFVLNQGAAIGADGRPAQLLRPELLAECFKPSARNRAYGLTWWLASGDGVSAAADGGSGGVGGGRLLARLRARTPAAEPAQQAKGPDGSSLIVHMAAGKGKQRLYVLPQYDMVIVRFAEDTPAGFAFSDAEFLSRVLKQ